MITASAEQTIMKLILKRLNHEPSASLIDLLKQELASLSPQLQIDEAHVQLERRDEASPPFRVAMHLVTPGPDVETEATDHTLRAAMLKAFEAVRNKIGHRHQKRARRKVPTHVTSLSRLMSAAGPRR